MDVRCLLVEYHISVFRSDGKNSKGKNMSTAIQQVNRDLADKLIDEARQNPGAFTGRFVGIANGKLIVVTDDLDELGSRLRQADPDSANRFWFELGRDYQEVHEIWEIS